MRIKVSVPYRGATFLNYTMYIMDMRSDKVSVPYRGATFLNRNQTFVEKVFNVVSVPYRGATFLNDDADIGNYVYGVSVPYRGATFLNESMISKMMILRLFPSPIGELHFSINAVQHKE